MYFTQHAIERFRERFVPQFSHGRAKHELIALVPLARPLREHTAHGEQRWLIDDGTSRIVLVVKRDHRGPDGLTCVTVLQADEPWEDQPDAVE